jgi:hypothetical protein
MADFLFASLFLFAGLFLTLKQFDESSVLIIFKVFF